MDPDDLLNVWVHQTVYMYYNVMYKPDCAQMFNFWVLVFATGLVQLILAGLPLRSCLGHWGTFCAGGHSQSPFSLLLLMGLEPMQPQSIQQVPAP